MEHAAFDHQLSDDQLRELGRMTVNFGYAELLLDWLLLAALNVRNPKASRTLITPLPTKRKIELLKAELPNCPNTEASSLISKASDRIESANSDRNQIIHGYWALKNGVGVMAYFKKDPSKSHLTPAAVADIADNVALASRELYQAYNLLNDRPLDTSSPHVLCPNDDGSYKVLVKSSKT